MSAYATPGVYREDIFARPDEGLPIGVPAFIGLVPAAFAGGIARLTLWDEFAERCGPPLPGSLLAPAVRGFFANGGRLCYVLGVGGALSQSALGAALARLEALDAVDLVCAPDLALLARDDALRLQQLLLEHCDTQPGGRFAILDARRDAAPQDVLAQRERLRGTSGALYYPWIDVGTRDERGMPVYLPPCGHVAGVYARSDRAAGVHKSPANEALEGVLDLQFGVTDAQQRPLNAAGVNCLRALPGRGIRVWGARTLSAEPAWRYIGTRRLFLTVGRWIERAMPALVYEPNDGRLWARVERELGAYCAGLFRQGALAGRSAPESFYVKCDAELNPPAARERGELIVEIGLRPVSTGEFVVVRIYHGAGGVSLGAPPSL